MQEDKIKAYDELLKHIEARINKLKMHKASIMRKRARALRCVNSPNRQHQLDMSKRAEEIAMAKTPEGQEQLKEERSRKMYDKAMAELEEFKMLNGLNNE